MVFSGVGDFARSYKELYEILTVVFEKRHLSLLLMPTTRDVSRGEMAVSAGYYNVTDTKKSVLQYVSAGVSVVRSGTVQAPECWDECWSFRALNQRPPARQTVGAYPIELTGMRFFRRSKPA